MQNKSLALKAGTQLQNGRYVITGVLGQGGFGITYEAMQTSLNKRVAIKEYFLCGFCIRAKDQKTVVVPIESNQDSYNSLMKRFHTEADRLAHLGNPHLVAVHDLFEENGTSYFVMDFVKGRSLSNIIEQSPTPLAEKEVMSILDQMLDALEFIHSQNPPLCHLDIKPANIMVDDKGHAMLIDFGASKYSTGSDATITSTVVAYTPSFAPVEQLTGDRKNMGPWTDFYALGATLYNMLTLHKPVEPSEIVADKTPDKVQSLPLPPSVSQRLRQLILWLMSFDKTKRPQSVAEIRRWMSKDNTIRIDTPIKRKFNLTALLASLLVIVLLAGGCFLYLNTSREKEPSIEIQEENLEKEKHDEQQSSNSLMDGGTSEESSSEVTETASELHPVYMGMWGTIGESNFLFSMDGTTGEYIPEDIEEGTEDKVRRQLKLVSYNPENGRCVINAFFKNKYIGQFNGVFSEKSDAFPIESYNGTFTSVEGSKLEFILHYED